MVNKDLQDLADELGGVLDVSRCLCLGSGATLKFVGTWDQLLGTMLGERFIHRWTSDGHDASMVSGLKNKDVFSNFFDNEGYLEKGEFLLAEQPEPTVSEREKAFSMAVDAMIQRSIAARLGKQCARGSAGSCKKARERSGCPLTRSGKRTLGEVFRAYQLFCDMDKDGDDLRECALVNGVDTTMALVELCATGKVRYVINYNFDLVIEEALWHVLEGVLATPAAHATTPIDAIHVWTYGRSKEQEEIRAGSKCRVVLHRGRWQDDVECLKDPSAIHFFHVHGVASGPTITSAAGNLVFSQHSYEEYQDSPLNWSNQVLDHMLARYDVIGVGFSGVDANYRYFAKLHNGASRNALFGESGGAGPNKQTILLKAKAPYRNSIKAEPCVSDDAMADTFLEYCCEMVTNYYSGFYHIRTVWADEYADVAEVVHRIAVR